MPLAVEESHLPDARLQGELSRTTGQLELLADEVAAAARGGGDRPRGRRLGPPRPGPAPDDGAARAGAVFAASNFPFAFTVAGGDTASALAAGCPVVVKAHRGHPRLSVAVAEAVRRARRRRCSRRDVRSRARVEAGRALVQHPGSRRGAFTGSVAPAGRSSTSPRPSRPDPVLRRAGQRQPGVGDPGGSGRARGRDRSGVRRLAHPRRGPVLHQPRSAVRAAGPEVLGPPRRRSPRPEPRPCSTTGSQRATCAGSPRSVRWTGCGWREGSTGGDPRRRCSRSTSRGSPRRTACPRSASDRSPSWSPTRPGRGARRARGARGAIAHRDRPRGGRRAARRSSCSAHRNAGRLLWNGWPTGVAVTYAMHHGGPYPAATCRRPRSGTAAIGRFGRPVAYQDVPDALLPP